MEQDDSIGPASPKIGPDRDAARKQKGNIRAFLGILLIFIDE